jgi:nuclear transport factor 2 (NTF2) superfamily protein
MAEQRKEMDAIAALADAPTFDNTIVAMERSGQTLTRVSNVFFNLVGANTNDAMQKVQAAEDAWNSRDPVRVSLAYTADTEWRNRAEFVNGREQVVTFLQGKWARELDYRLKKTLWAFMDNRIAVRFEYEWHDDTGAWFRSHGNENWEFAENGLMQKRYASINDQPIAEAERKFRWER